MPIYPFLNLSLVTQATLALIVLLLIGGDKRSQDQDVKTAKKLAKEHGNAA
jgi:putative component of toxin-antitoxin plasmid stabilization module